MKEGRASDCKRTIISKYFGLKKADVSLCKNETFVQIDETVLQQIEAPIVILGEAGVGKSYLLENYAKQVSGNKYSASKFLRTSDISTILDEDQVAIIDGLDEVPSSYDGEAVQKVLEKLSQVNYPKFILACRAADWDGVVNSINIQEDYDIKPLVGYLEPFSKSEAIGYLNEQGLSVSSDIIIRTLDNNNLSEFFGNPQTLELIAKAMVGDNKVPDTMQEILHRSLGELIKEMNDKHKGDIAAELSPEQLYDAGGAICAMLVLSGKDSIYTGAYADTDEESIHYSELSKLPDFENVLEVIKTRLFLSVSEKAFKPIHRIVSDYLAAHWLAKCIHNGSSKKRLLAIIQPHGYMPSSLRGLGAWLSYHSPELFKEVIVKDPYGCIKYGDCSKFNDEQAELLLVALKKLAVDDPLFMRDDYGGASTSCLGKVVLKEQVLEIIQNVDESYHLQEVIHASIHATPLIPHISVELKELMMDYNRYYFQRHWCITSLIEANQPHDWEKIIFELLANCTEDDTSLAVLIFQLRKGIGFSNKLIFNLVIHETRLNISYLSERHDRNRTITLDATLLAQNIPSSSLVYILNKISPYLSIFVDRYHNHDKHELGHFLSHALARAISKNIELPLTTIWSIVRSISRITNHYRDDEDKTIKKYFDENVEVRRELQSIVLWSDEPNEEFYDLIYELGNARDILGITDDDLLFHLNHLINNKRFGREFKDLSSLAIYRENLKERAVKLLTPYMQQSTELKEYWDHILNPKPSKWQIRQEKKDAERERERLEKFAEHRQEFLDHIASRSNDNFGLLNWAKNVYLGRFRDVEGDSPKERITYWLGEDITNNVLKWFEDYLYQDNIPSAKAIAEAHAESKEYNTEAIMIASLNEHIVNDRSIENISRERLLATLVALERWPDHFEDRLGNDLSIILKDHLLKTDNHKTDFLDVLMTPHIEAGRDHVNGLWGALRRGEYDTVLPDLCKKWLKVKDINHLVEIELADYLLKVGEYEFLSGLCGQKLRPSQEREQRVFWLSLAALIQFNTYQSDIKQEIETNREFIWAVRNRLKWEERANVFSLSVPQLKFFIFEFGNAWPKKYRRGVSSGDCNDHDATEFIFRLISELSAIKGPEAMKALNDLSLNGPKEYLDFIKNRYIASIRSNIDNSYKPMNVAQIKAVLTRTAPETIDDLKAYTLDQLDDLQAYLDGSDVDSKNKFYKTNETQNTKTKKKVIREVPRDENDCRNELIDLLRPRLGTDMMLVPETQMAELKRVDINVFKDSFGIPIEIKGQWHTEIWNAPISQLDEYYTRDWRADGRGIYLVLWFGNIPYKNLPKHPEGLAKPKTPEELKNMLINRIPAERRQFIDVVVLDLSK